MTPSHLVPGVLVLEGGSEFPGFLFGAPFTPSSFKKSLGKKDFGQGEVVFNTSMTGYQEILTDPSYYGQIVCMTTPHIGNTGINSLDAESRQAWLSGFVIHQLCEDPHQWRSEGSLNDYLKEHQIPGILGVDTRKLTRFLRSRGVARGVILPQDEKHLAPTLFSAMPSLEGRNLMGEVSTSQPYFWNQTQTQANYRVIALDFGIKWNLLRCLEQRGCAVEVVPSNTSARDILARNPDGIFLSNGPGDPAAAFEAIQTVREILGKKPILGVCMGHQILALAIGAKTYKLKFGHRGGNQPVLDRTTGKIEISSHNHGFAVDAASLPAFAQITHINLNDKTVEGMSLPLHQAISVQYHPEACPGPHDSVLFFDQFVKFMKK